MNEGNGPPRDIPADDLWAQIEATQEAESLPPANPCPSSAPALRLPSALPRVCACLRREEGVMALWRGWLPSVIGVVPYVGLNFGVYETAKDVIIKMYGAYRTVPHALYCKRGIPACAAARQHCATRCQQHPASRCRQMR